MCGNGLDGFLLTKSDNAKAQAQTSEAAFRWKEKSVRLILFLLARFYARIRNISEGGVTPMIRYGKEGEKGVVNRYRYRRLTTEINGRWKWQTDALVSIKGFRRKFRALSGSSTNCKPSFFPLEGIEYRERPEAKSREIFSRTCTSFRLLPKGKRKKENTSQRRIIRRSRMDSENGCLGEKVGLTSEINHIYLLHSIYEANP